MPKFILLYGLCFGAILQINAQPYFPLNGSLYCDTCQTKIEITLADDSLNSLLLNPDSDYEYRASCIITNSLASDSISDIGLRVRGNTSRQSEKKSFRISFNTFVKGRKYRSVEKLNLNGEHNDPGIIRSKLCWDMLRLVRVPAPRANHIELYINNTYFGLYINVEHIDENFVKSRFGNNDGNLYKCLYPADLKFISLNSNDYKFGKSYRTYELKTNEIEDDYADLAHFIDILNHTKPDSMYAVLNKVFDVNTYLKIVALDILTGNWDGYVFNKNNYYLYQNTKTSVFEYIPYDLDNTFGIDWFGMDWGNRDIWSWNQAGSSRPLYTALLRNPVLKKHLKVVFKNVLDSVFNPTILFPKIDSIYYRIASSAEKDEFRTKDYGWTFSDFQNSFTESLGDHVKYGLKPYITQRYNSALAQLDFIEDITNLAGNEIGVYPNPFKRQFYITGKFRDETVIVSISNVSGYKLFEKEYPSSSINIVLEGNTALPDGAYIVSVKSKKETYHSKAFHISE